MGENHLFWIGLTGGMGSGKSTVASILRTLGEDVVDADLISKSALSPGSEAFVRVVDIFGTEVLGKNQEFDRKRLGEIVFSDKGKLLLLEDILHPIIRKEVEKKKKILSQQGVQRAFYDVPLLFEKDMVSQFDQVVVVNCDEEQQYLRLKKRNGWSEKEIKNRLNSQISLIEKVKKADVVIYNNSNQVELQRNVEKYVDSL